jgi:hypothetical protein
MSTDHALEGGDLSLCASLAEWDEVLPPAAAPPA